MRGVYVGLLNFVSGMGAGFWKLMLPFSGGNMCFGAVAKFIPFFKEWVSATGRRGQGIFVLAKARGF